MAEIVFRPKVSQRGPTYFAERCSTLGPQVLAVTGDNSMNTLFGREWLAVMGVDRVLHLYQESAGQDGEWTEVTENLPPVFGEVLPVDARHLTIAFDQSARIITAYETGGIVKVTRWDTTLNAYIQNVSFAGCDPVLYMDALTLATIPDSDVVLYYLSPDRTRLHSRIQRDAYGVAREHYLLTDLAASYPEAEAPFYLDQATPLGFRHQLHFAKADGEPVLTGAGERVALISDLYPISAHTRANLAGAFTSGSYDEWAFLRGWGVHVGLGGAFLEGLFESTTQEFYSVVAIGLEGAFASGLFESVVKSAAAEIAVGLEGEILEGLYEFVAFAYTQEIHVGLTGAFTGGVYATP